MRSPAFAKLALLILAYTFSASAQDTPLLTTDAPVKKTIELEWESEPNAFGYEVRLTREGTKTPLLFRTFEARLSEEVPAGVYALRIRSRHREHDLWSDWSEALRFEVLQKDLIPLEPIHDAMVLATANGREEVEFKWTSIEKAKSYTLKIWTEETKANPITFVTRKNSQRLKLLQGRVYFWQVTFESATAVTYIQQVKTASFVLQGPKLVQPSIRPFEKVKEGEPIALNWIGSKKAEQYRCRLQFRFLDESQWRPIKEHTTKEKRWEFGKLPPGAYRLEVVAQAARNADSDPGYYEFLIKPKSGDLAQALQN